MLCICAVVAVMRQSSIVLLKFQLDLFTTAERQSFPANQDKCFSNHGVGKVKGSHTFAMK